VVKYSAWPDALKAKPEGRFTTFVRYRVAMGVVEVLEFIMTERMD